MAEEPKVTPITSAVDQKKARQIEKDMKKAEQQVDRFEKMVSEYYSFFRIGGALTFLAFKSMDGVEKAAVVAAKKRVREEEAKFTMRMMMGVFNHCLGEIMSHAPGETPRTPAPEGSKELLSNLITTEEVKPEEAAVSKVLDTLADKGVLSRPTNLGPAFVDSSEGETKL
jgi:hypothetical protein